MAGPLHRIEWLALLLVLVIGLALRMGRLEATTIEHFDEGVYASNLLFGEEYGYAFPMRRFYAPPLLPWLIEGALILVGQLSGVAALIPSLVAGCLTVPLAWWVARCWFGPAAGIAAGCAAACNDVHVLLSRAALTDVLLVLLLMMALGLFARAFRSHDWLDFAAAGAVTGVAWWTKYNGWLPLLIACGGPVAWCLTGCQPRRLVGRLCGGWCVAVAVAAVVWGPYLYALQATGGYAPIAANHRQYVVGLAGAIGSLTHQLANLRYVDGSAGHLGWGLMITLSWLVQRYSGTRADNSPLAVGKFDPGKVAPGRFEGAAVVLGTALAVVLSHFVGASLLGVACALASLAIVWSEPLWNRASASAETIGNRPPHFRWPGTWMLTSWLLLLLVLTPLYTPYLRLVLPLLGASWIGCGLLLAQLVQIVARHEERDEQLHARFAPWLVAALAVGAGLFAELLLGIQTPLAWRDSRRGLERTASEIRIQLDATAGNNPASGEVQYVVYVYGEPALLFHLRAAGLPVVLPADSADLSAVRLAERVLPTFLVAGLHADKDSGFRQQQAQLAARFRLVRSYSYHPSVLVMLDQVDPRRDRVENTTKEVRLYQVTE